MKGEAEQLTIKIKIMKEQFIPYEQALELKELGFDKRCFTTYTPKHLGNELSNPFNIDLDEFNELKSSFTLIKLPNKAFVKNSECVNCVSAPLWQQAFDWFRDKYNLVSEIFHNPEYEWKNWKYRFYWTTERLRLSNISDGHYETYEEARLECLKKLIEIIKHDY